MKLNNSVYNGVIAIKNQLTESIRKQNQTLDCISDGLMTSFPDALSNAISLEIPNQKLTLCTDNVVSIQKNASNDSISFFWNDGDTEHTVTRSFSQLSADLGENVKLFSYDSEIDPSHVPDITIENIMQSLSNGEATNEAIAKVNELYLTNPNNSNSDIINMINTVSGGQNSDLDTLKTTLIGMSTDGKVSNYGWMTYINKLLSGSKQTVDSGSLIVSEEDFFTLQTFLETVLDVASTVFSAVLTVLSSVLGGLLSVVSIIFNVALTLFNSTFDLDYNYKPNATYPGIKGTYFAGVDPDHVKINGLPNDTAIRICYGSEDVFIFQQGNETDGYKVYVQSQPILSFHPTRVINYIRHCFNATIHTEAAGYQWTIQLDRPLTPNFDENLPDITSDDYPFLRTEEYVNLGLDKDEMIRTLKVNILMSVLLRCTQIVNIPVAVLVVDESSYVKDDARCYALWFFEKVVRTSESASQILDRFSIANIRKCVTDMLSFSTSADESSLYRGYAADSSLLWSGYFYNRPLHFIRYGSQSPFPAVFTVNSGVITIDDDMQNYYTDSIPSEDIISIPSLDVSTVIAALAVVASITAATLIAGKKLNNALKTRKQVKQTKRIGKLNELRNNYLNNPTDVNKRTYEKALSSYNMKSSIFGWGSYDAANGWMNAPDVTSSSTTSATLSTTNIISAVNKVSRLITTE